jgi:DNA-binding transcriptional ArsR family regulator
MRPLLHPSMQDVTVEGILHALSDPVRVAIFAAVVSADCPRNCSNFLTVGNRRIPKSTLSQHLKALRDAGLILGERQGVEMHLVPRCAEIDQRFPGLLPAILNAYKSQLESRPKKKKLSA